MKKLLFILFFIPVFAAAQNIFVSYSAPYPPPPYAACGSQVWASANLNAGTETSSSANNPQASGGKWCYNDVAANCTIYGGLYDWNNAAGLAPGGGMGAASTCNPCGTGGIQGMCPAGYHIPTDLEWSKWEFCIEDSIAPIGTTTFAFFSTTVGNRGSSAAGIGPGDKMKAPASYAAPWDGTNTSGFTALPAGLFYSTNSWAAPGSRALFWTATEANTGNAWSRELDTGNAQSWRYYNTIGETEGQSVRCLHN